MENAIEINQICRAFDGFQLGPLDLTLPRGFIMGLIGENGAGKTTLIKLITNVLRKDSGKILVLGQDSTALPPETKEKIGVVYDEVSLPDELNALELGLVLKNIYQTWQPQTFEQYMNRFDLPWKKKIKTLSRGMKAKLSLVVALSHDPDLLILDEATSGLDPVVRDEMMDLFLEFIQDENHAILISSHIGQDLEKVCDQITFVHQGKIVFNKTKDELSLEYGLFRGAAGELATLDPAAIVGMRQHSFGAEALVLRDLVPASLPLERASVEEIMLYHIREKVR